MAYKSLIKDTSGAVTLDWLVLTIAVVGLAVVVLSSLSDKFFGPDFGATETSSVSDTL